MRLVALNGCLNFRELGGYPTRDGRHLRRGLLYRSDALHHMTDEDVRHVREELGVRAVIDLRTTVEVRSEGPGPLTQPPVAYHHLPLFDGEASKANEAEPRELPDDLGHQYFLLLRAATGPVAHILELLAFCRAPAVYHCAAGKDRTGVISALLLGLLGVDDEKIVEDYVYTSRNLDRIIERLRQTPSYHTLFERLPPSTLHAEPETMIGFLGRVREEFGSMTGYALAAGVRRETLAGLEARLLE
ncbi:MAG: tyrosine-protein phosphatase [Myxococcota bacterium]